MPPRAYTHRIFVPNQEKAVNKGNRGVGCRSSDEIGANLVVPTIVEVGLMTIDVKV